MPLEKQTLFWDRDLSALNSTKHMRFIIERILAYGDADDVRWAMDFYSQNKIRDVVMESRSLDRKSRNFWCKYFNISSEACLQKQSMSAPGAFLQR